MLLYSLKNLIGCKRYRLFITALIYSCSAFSQIKTPGPEIVLHNEQQALKSAGFYVANVRDERENKTAVARIISLKNGLNTQVFVDFNGGGLIAIKKFIDQSILKDTTNPAINIRLKKFEANETPAANGQVEGHIVLSFSFDLETETGKTIPLGAYNSSTDYNRTIGSAQDIEPALQHMLQNGLTYISKWVSKQANTNILFAKRVKITFTDFSEKTENDTIYYSVGRPLKWDDFQSNTPAAKYDALVFASIGYTEEVSVENGIIIVNLNMKVFLPKSACWVKDGSKTDYALNHEQRHFDIAKIMAERFKQKLKTEQLPVSNYDGLINIDYLDAYREMDALQKQYDDETNHGTNQNAQQRWNEKIDNELRRYGVKGK